MEQKTIQTILDDTAFIHVGGTPEERKVADYLKNECEKRGVSAVLETFEVPWSSVKHARLLADQVEILANPYY
ncbi:MAG: hypothetical protein IJM69_08280, partial [Firmicutes bacterium]|nr:hypothetical protein [Bacillota bacterium]